MELFVEYLKINQLQKAAVIYQELKDKRSFTKDFKKTMDRYERKTYLYMVTFTLRENHSEEETEIIGNFIESQAFRPALDIIKASIVKEYTKKGRAHWHMAIESKKLLKKDRFNYYIQKYGNVDISKNRHNNSSEMINYMSKSDTIKILL